MLTEKIDADLRVAMRARDAARLAVLRSLKAALKNAAIEKGGASAVLDDTEVTAVLRKQAKQREDSIQSFEAGGRDDLAAAERFELEVLATYLPPPLTLEEVSELAAAAIAEVGATSRAQMGVVMKVLQERAGGRADGRTLSQAVQKLLAQ